MLKITTSAKQNISRLINEKKTDNLDENIGLILGIKSSVNDSYCLAVVKKEIYSAYKNIGIYNFNNNVNDEVLIDNITRLIHAKNGIIFVITSLKNKDDIQVKTFNLNTNKFEENKYEIIDGNKFISDCIQTSCTGILSFEVKYNKNIEKFRKNLDEECEKQIKQFKKTVFTLENSAFTMKSNKKMNLLINDLYFLIEDEETNQIRAMPGKEAVKQKILNELHKKRKENKISFNFKFNDKLDESNFNEKYLQEDDQIEIFNFKINFVLLVNQNLALTAYLKLYENLIGQIANQFKEILLKNFTDKELIVKKPETYNFLIDEFSSTIFTILYEKKLNEEELKPMRSRICDELNLPKLRPLIRRSNAIKNFKNLTENKILSNVHANLAENDQPFSTLLFGKYSYYHYMQNNIDDNGWGCAYRSLQTIISWFQLQGYIEDEKIPMHQEIQQALVDVGDKQSNFVGSKQWIGSQEVGFVLNHLYGIVSKFIYVSSGLDLACKGRELAQHFKIQGTPIMIGGGMLAHTILGVNFNENTGKLKFLVLDPHYIGTEDIKIIQNKGWCGWKDVKFWQANSFYNLCMPQRPNLF